MKRGLLLVSLLSVLFFIPVVVSGVPDARLTVDSVSVSPGTPTAGEPLTVEATVASSVGSTDAVTIDSVTLTDGDEDLAEASGIGALSPGDSVDAPLTTRLQEPGEYNLFIEVHGTDADGESVEVTRPVTVVVESGGPAIELTPETAVNGTISEVSTVVANPTEVPLRNIIVSYRGEGIVSLDDNQVIPRLAPGEETTVEGAIRPEQAGETELQAIISYTTPAGTTATRTRFRELTVDPLEPDVSIRISTAAPAEDSDNGIGVDVPGLTTGNSQETDSETGAWVTVANVGNAPISTVRLDGQTRDRPLPVQPVANSLAPGEEETVQAPLERIGTAGLTFNATYTVAGAREETSVSLGELANRGSIRVTSIDVEIDGEDATISGDVGNPGGEPVSGVVVGIDDAEWVGPAYPAGDFFLGEIDGNSFAPFELTATVDENATQVPLSVEYQVEGDQRTETVQFPVPDTGSEDGGSSVSWLVVFLMIVSASAIGIVAVVNYRKR